MIARVVLAVLMLGILGALLYFKDPDNGAADQTAGADAPAEPGFAALHAVLIETGEDGEALYRLTADRMEQPQPKGTIFLTAPQLEYQPEVGNQWHVHALRGQLPQDARTAELDGMVHGEGKPAGSDALMRFDTEEVHLDMLSNLATSTGDVHVDWDGNQLLGRGMTADLNRYTLQLQSDVRGTLTH